MQQDVILRGADVGSRLEEWDLLLKIVATGITATLVMLLIVFTVSLRKDGHEERRAAFHFAWASFFATLYIGADTLIAIRIATGQIHELLNPYRLILSAIVLSVAAYMNLCRVLDPDHSARRSTVAALYAGAAVIAGLVWLNHPALIIASDRVTIEQHWVYADYGAGAPLFFALCLTLFAAVCLNLIRQTRRTISIMSSRIVALACVALFLTGVHDALRELRVLSSPVALLTLSYAFFQVGVFAVLALHYSRMLRDRQAQSLKLRRLTDAVSRDTHTGLFTRAHLENNLNQLGITAQGGLLFIDLDRFKQINDRFGHGCGDEFIRAVAHHIRDNMRSGDIPCRWGGDEFVVYLPGTDADALRSLTDRLQQALGTIRLAGATQAEISVSMGFAELCDGDWHVTLERADHAMYHAKQAGRSQLALAP